MRASIPGGRAAFQSATASGTSGFSTCSLTSAPTPVMKCPVDEVGASTAKSSFNSASSGAVSPKERPSW